VDGLYLVSRSNTTFEGCAKGFLQDFEMLSAPPFKKLDFDPRSKKTKSAPARNAMCRRVDSKTYVSVKDAER
jgi:hypothetical protein